MRAILYVVYFAAWAVTAWVFYSGAMAIYAAYGGAAFML